MTPPDHRRHFNAAGEDGLRGIPGRVGAFHYADYTLRRIAPPPGARVLDAGCGDGRVLSAARELRPDCRFTGMDFAETLIAQAVTENTGIEGLDFRVGDIRSPPGDIGTFDRIYTFSVAQYLPPAELAAATRALANFLNPGGSVWHLSVPDLQKRVPMFLDCYLNAGRKTYPEILGAALRTLAADLKRRVVGDRAYGDSLFHRAEELAALAPQGLQPKIVRPSDSWYRFDVGFEKTDH